MNVSMTSPLSLSTTSSLTFSESDWISMNWLMSLLALKSAIESPSCRSLVVDVLVVSGVVADCCHAAAGHHRQDDQHGEQCSSSALEVVLHEVCWKGWLEIDTGVPPRGRRRDNWRRRHGSAALAGQCFGWVPCHSPNLRSLMSSHSHRRTASPLCSAGVGVALQRVHVIVSWSVDIGYTSVSRTSSARS